MNRIRILTNGFWGLCAIAAIPLIARYFEWSTAFIPFQEVVDFKPNGVSVFFSMLMLVGIGIPFLTDGASMGMKARMSSVLGLSVATFPLMYHVLVMYTKLVNPGAHEAILGGDCKGIPMYVIGTILIYFVLGFTALAASQPKPKEKKS